MAANPSPQENHDPLPFSSRERRLRDAESIRQEYVRKTGPIPRPPIEAPTSGDDQAEGTSDNE